jgi:hypothetical protein
MDGTIDVSTINHISDSLLKRNDEKFTDQLLRVVEFYLERSADETRKFFKKATYSAFSSAARGLFDQNKMLSTKLGNTLSREASYESIPIPENPVYETNRTLEAAGKELKELAYLIKNMNGLGVQVTQDTAASSVRTNRWNNVMFVLGLGLITLIVTAVLSYKSLERSNNSSKRLEDIFKEQSELLSIESEGREVISNTIQTFAQFLETDASNDADVRQQLKELADHLRAIRVQSTLQFQP